MQGEDAAIALFVMSGMVLIAFAFATAFAVVFRARFTSGSQRRYEELVRESTEVQAQFAAALTEAATEIRALRTRVEATERLLQEVG